MNKFKKLTLAAVVAVVLGAGLALVAALSSRPLGNDWPAQIRQDPGNRKVPPQMVLLVQPNDYGYRLGDAVPVTAYIRYPLNWQVDAGAAEMTGDFSELSVRSVNEQVRGKTNYVRVRFDVQSFQPKPLLQGTISLPCYDRTHSQPYIITGSFTAGTSPTWDGRMRLIPSATKKAAPGFWPAALLLLVGLGGCCYCTVYATRRRHGRPKPLKPISPREQQGRLFFAAWAECCADRCNLSAVRAMDTLVRRWLGVEAVLPQDLFSVLEDKAVAGAAAVVLTHCERVLFAQIALTEEQCGEIATSGKVLFPEASHVLNGRPQGNSNYGAQVSPQSFVPPAVNKEE